MYQEILDQYPPKVCPPPNQIPNRNQRPPLVWSLAHARLAATE